MVFHRQMLFNLAIAASFRLLAVFRRDSCEPTTEKIDLGLTPVVGLVLQVGDAENFPLSPLVALPISISYW